MGKRPQEMVETVCFLQGTFNPKSRIWCFREGWWSDRLADTDEHEFELKAFLRAFRQRSHVIQYLSPTAIYGWGLGVAAFGG